MVGAFSLLNSTIIDSLNCIDTPRSFCSSTSSNNNNNNNNNNKQSRRKIVGYIELNNSFINDNQRKNLLCLKNKRNSRRKIPKLLGIVNNLGGQYEESFEDVKTQLLNYFTQKAVRTVMTQLYEMSPPKYTWLYNFLVTNKPEDGKIFIRNLAKENQDLAERIMVTRLHLYGRWIKKCNHGEIYKFISDENLELMREKLLDTIVWPSEDTNT